MDLYVVPPFTDFTTEVVPPAGAEVLDLNEHLVQRLADPRRLRSARSRTGLFGRAAAAILERKAFDEAHLRAIGTALRLAADPAVRLTIDDLELAEGSTQSSRDVLGAADRCELFGPELGLAAEAAAGRRAHVVVDAEQQLPAAFALVRALGAHRVTLCGRLVAEQVAALRRVPALAGVEWRERTPERVIRPIWYAPAAASLTGTGVRGTSTDGGFSRPVEPVRWLTGKDQPPATGPWAGWLDAARVAAFPPEALGRCRGLTISMTRIDFLAAVTGLNGMTVNLRRLLAALPAEVPVACELAVGAPGMAAGVVGESLELLADGPGGVRAAGLRPYRMGIRSVWAGQSVRFPPPAADDLARWIDFAAPETMGAREVRTLIGHWRDRLPGLPPGRLAACSIAGAPSSPACVWDPCAEVVADSGPDGRETFAVSLRSGRSFRLHQGLVAPVSRLAAADPHALDGLTAGARAWLTTGLAEAGVLRGRG
ncbi:hypothetical protein SAMN05444920_117126 [Nonomuraea solani]|uniref:Uncharacterized protein n=1 Tax=Nonomuraea solani TaxID=1144553 RepID=A0A1H6EUU5_9ACTN|nr:hypothetical protein [Nonomuraea solani]SEH00695.1 hypothetical protein SAMN05444920_117126 [Nonomuraea solani]